MSAHAACPNSSRDFPAAAQFGLHPESGAGNVILVKPADRSVFQRSREESGLRRVSPSLMTADLDEGPAFTAALRWLAKHKTQWRQKLHPPEVGQRGRSAQSRA